MVFALSRRKLSTAILVDLNLGTRSASSLDGTCSSTLPQSKYALGLRQDDPLRRAKEAA